MHAARTASAAGSAESACTKQAVQACLDDSERAAICVMLVRYGALALLRGVFAHACVQVMHIDRIMAALRRQGAAGPDVPSKVDLYTKLAEAAQQCSLAAWKQAFPRVRHNEQPCHTAVARMRRQGRASILCAPTACR